MGWTVSHLVADVGDRISRITTAGLTPRGPVQVPVSVLALVTEDADHPRPAGTLSCPGVAETGTPQRAVSHLRASPVTGAFWESNSLYHDTYEATPTAVSKSNHFTMVRILTRPIRPMKEKEVEQQPGLGHDW